VGGPTRQGRCQVITRDGCGSRSGRTRPGAGNAAALCRGRGRLVAVRHTPLATLILKVPTTSRWPRSGRGRFHPGSGCEPPAHRRERLGPARPGKVGWNAWLRLLVPLAPPARPWTA
jgi:hypothetical protein